MRAFRCGTTTVRHVGARSSPTAAAQETGTDSIQSGSVVGSARLGELRHEMQQRKGCPICHPAYKYNAHVIMIVVYLCLCPIGCT